jgi:hypothetical protein
MVEPDFSPRVCLQGVPAFVEDHGLRHRAPCGSNCRMPQFQPNPGTTLLKNPLRAHDPTSRPVRPVTGASGPETRARRGRPRAPVARARRPSKNRPGRGRRRDEGEPKRGSDGPSTWVRTAGSWTPTGHRAGTPPPERDFLVGSVTIALQGRSGPLRSGINLDVASDLLGTPRT